MGAYVKIRSVGAYLAATLLGVLGTVATHPIAAGAAVPHTSCVAGTPPIAPATTDFYDPAHPEFGPAHLPRATTIGPLLLAYHRFGTLSESQFATEYRSGSSWIYPPDNGFLIVSGRPVEYEQTLLPGSEIDRFGYSGGGYLSPAGTLFTERALPPQNLDTPTDTPVANYHLYCVEKPFPVDAGPIAPWFQQLGLGIQYKLDATLLPRAGSALNVTWLLANGYLVEQDPA
jgi:Tuberculosis necrotizing toxin